MKRIRGTRQHDRSDCGAACLCSIARAFGYDIPLSEMRELASTDRDGTNVMGLIEASEKMGFFARGIKGPPEAFSSSPLPSIAHMRTERNLFHFVVLTGIGKNRVKYMDPEHGSIQRTGREDFLRQWTGVLVILAPAPTFRKSVGNPSPASRLFGLVKPFRPILLQALLGAVLYSLLGLSTSLFVQKIVDFVLINRNLNLLNIMGVAMIFILLARMLVSWFKGLFLLKAGHQIDAGLVLGYFRHLLSLPQRFFDSMLTGEILSRINDAVKVRVFINRSLVEGLVAILTILLTLLAMALLSWQLCLLVASALPVYALVYVLFDRFNKSQLRRIMEESAGLESQLVESIQCQRTIRAFSWHSWSLNRTAEKLVRFLKVNYRTGIISMLAGHSGEFLSGLLIIGLLWTGSVRVIGGMLSPGELMSFYAMLGYLLGPVREILNLNSILRDALIAADRLFQILDLKKETNAASGIRVNSIRCDIEFCDVRFRYGARPELFNGLSFVIPRGKMTGIIGNSGSGKSTIASLLRAEYLPSEGKLMINGCDIRQIERSSLRKRIAMVPQRIELFSGSILENIVPAEPEPDVEKLFEIAERTGLIRFIRQLPAGFHTELGEGGKNLSGGERQRIALARALYRDPEMLIMDEATASLDPLSESEILGTLRDLCSNGMTVLLITHKLSQVKKADRIVLIGQGKALESGTHGELLRMEGSYSRLLSSRNS